MLDRPVTDLDGSALKSPQTLFPQSGETASDVERGGGHVDMGLKKGKRKDRAAGAQSRDEVRVESLTGVMGRSCRKALSRNSYTWHPGRWRTRPPLRWFPL